MAFPLPLPPLPLPFLLIPLQKYTFAGPTLGRFESIPFLAIFLLQVILFSVAARTLILKIPTMRLI